MAERQALQTDKVSQWAWGPAVLRACPEERTRASLCSVLVTADNSPPMWFLLVFPAWIKRRLGEITDDQDYLGDCQLTMTYKPNIDHYMVG